MKAQEWVEFGMLYEKLENADITPNLITNENENEEGITYHVLITDCELDFDDSISDVYDKIDDWYTTPLLAIKARYLSDYLMHEPSTIIDRLSEEEVDQLARLSNGNDIPFDQVIADMISNGLSAIRDEVKCDCGCCKL